MEAGIMATLYDDHVETEWINTEYIGRPQPNTDAPSVEFESVEDVPKEMDRWVGFSGGKDSAAVTHYAMSEGMADGVVYCDTGSGLTENLDYVRRVCDRHGWPLAIVPPRHCYEFPALRYEFPGPDYHSVWFDICKGAGWRDLYNHINDSLKLITGVRKHESDKRRVSVTAEVQREKGNFRGWYISPFWDRKDESVDQYLNRHDIEINPAYETINRSGDCYCLAYGGRDELTVELQTHYPEHFAWLMNEERRVQEYRGRVRLLWDHSPNVMEYAKDTLRTQGGTPYPLIHIVLKRHLPAHYEWALKQPRRKAILRGMQEPTAWLGHGGESTKRLQRVAKQVDSSQANLCATCNAKSVMGVVPQVKRATQSAKEIANTTQSELSAYNAE